MWAAGFFEGEGCFGAIQGVIDINQVDRWPLDRFRRIVRAGNVNGPYQPRRGQPSYRLNISASRDVRRVTLLLRPLLSPRRQAQADALLARIEGKGIAWAKRTHCANGHRFTVANTFVRRDGARGCRACSQAATKRYRDSRRVDTRQTRA